MDELIRGKIHDALDFEQPADDLRARVMASLPVEPRAVRRSHARSFQLAGGLVAAFLALAIAAVILYSGRPINAHPPPQAACLYLYSPGGAFRPSTTEKYYFFVNESASACTIRAPQISFIDSAGNALDVPQDWAPGATDGALTLESMAAASIQFSIAPESCLTPSLQFVSTRISFGSGAEVIIPGTYGLCAGTRILVWAPALATVCADGTYVEIPPGGPKPSC
jgi:hypothetical protein